MIYPLNTSIIIWRFNQSEVRSKLDKANKIKFEGILSVKKILRILKGVSHFSFLISEVDEMKPNILLVQSLQALLTHTLTSAENVITNLREQKLGEPLAHTSCGSHKKPNWIIGGSGKLFDNVNVRCVNVNNGDKYTKYISISKQHQPPIVNLHSLFHLLIPGHLLSSIWHWIVWVSAAKHR